eukprot:7566716-Alexandrium_andersonii.AAC.1
MTGMPRLPRRSTAGRSAAGWWPWARTGPLGAACAAGLLPSWTGLWRTRPALPPACWMPVGARSSQTTPVSGCTRRSSAAGAQHANHAG